MCTVQRMIDKGGFQFHRVPMAPAEYLRVECEQRVSVDQAVGKEFCSDGLVEGSESSRH